MTQALPWNCVDLRPCMMSRLKAYWGGSFIVRWHPLGIVHADSAAGALISPKWNNKDRVVRSPLVLPSEEHDAERMFASNTSRLDFESKQRTFAWWLSRFGSGNVHQWKFVAIRLYFVVEQIDGFHVISADRKRTNDVKAGVGIIVGCRRNVEIDWILPWNWHGRQRYP